jgi:hypothetical protein
VRSPEVLLVDRLRDISQICEPIVERVAVQMIDDANRERSGHVQPSSAVGVVVVSINADDKPARLRIPACDSSRNAAPSAGSDPMSEHARLRVVAKKGAQTRGGKIGLSHEAVLSLIGQRPACVASTARASLFSPLAAQGASE